MDKKVVLFCIIAILVSTRTTYAQLDRAFENVFNQVLKNDLILSFEEHKEHFIPAADRANMALTPALNALIAHNVSSFPLTATVAGKTFDWSTGQPVPIRESLGPIFAETAETIGSGKINFGVNYTYLNLANFRGIATEDIRFTFTHQDVNEDGEPLGDVDEGEADVIDLILGMDLNATIFAFFATLGVTNNFDISLAIPVIDVDLRGVATARLDGPGAGFLHKFSIGNFSDIIPYEESATGIGDIGLRLKYNFVRGRRGNFAALLDIRFPTGREEDFLGTGKTNTKLSFIWSKKVGDFSPHLNLGYDRRPKRLDSDELEVIVGFDQKVVDGVTFAVEFLSEFDVDPDDDIGFFPEETVSLMDTVGTPPITAERIVDLTNIPEHDKDHTINASFGFRVAPTEHILFLVNIIVPLNDGGLRSMVTPTIGFTLSF